MSDIAEVDLYADVVDTFPQQDDHNNSSICMTTHNADQYSNTATQIDMLDEVIAAGASKSNQEFYLPSTTRSHQGGLMHLSNQDSVNFPEQPNVTYSSNAQCISSGSNTFPPSVCNIGKRVCLYVQNLTWWTTDEDLLKSVEKLEIDDLVEIKFLENRVNGQSKGIAIITVASDNSARLIIERLPRISIHGQNADVSHANRQSIHNVESHNPSHFGPSTNASTSNSSGNRRDISSNNNIGLGQMNIPRGYNQNVSVGGNSQIPIGNQAAAAFLINQLAQQASLFQQHSINQSPQRPQDVIAAMAQLTARFRSPHTRHLNPRAVHWNRADDQRSDMFNNRMMSVPRIQTDQHVRNSDHNQVDAIEIQQLLERNKIISSNALAAAVQSATDADYSTSIETLVTAISLIRQSKIANDERSQILISNLQNTLRSIEEKSYLSDGSNLSRDRHAVQTLMGNTGSHKSAEYLFSNKIGRRSSSTDKRDHSIHRRHSRSPSGYNERNFSKRDKRSPQQPIEYHRSRRRSSSSSSGGKFRHLRHDTKRHGSKHSSRGYSDYSSYSSDRRRR